jgi:HlyD family secretion protein
MKTVFPAVLLMAAACAAPADETRSGYVEADLVYLSPQDAGRIATLGAREGEEVAAGDILFTLDPARASIAAEQADAAAAGAAFRSGDAGALERRIAEAEAAEALARRDHARTRALFRDGLVARARMDQAETALKAAAARLDAARAEREVSAADRDWNAAAARLAAQRIADLSVRAPQAGVIERIYRRPGEMAAPGEPVVALLPPENLKIRFFAPQSELTRMQPGATISFSCDGCATGKTARISFVAREPQFTPPVIYSIEERDKLVFMIEARPDNAQGLRPGQPVTVSAP